MNESRKPRKTNRTAALIACAGALAYTVSKVDLAIKGELGMPGFPASPESYVGMDNIGAAQLGNAAFGLAMAAVALVLAWPPAVRLVRGTAVAVSWLGVAVIGTAVVTFGARAAGLAPALGEPPPALAPAVAALVVGAVWCVAWAVAAIGATRQPRSRVAPGTHPSVV